MKRLILLLLSLFLLSGTAHAAETWSSGQSHFYSRRGLTGGGTALDALSGLSMCSTDYSITLDTSGNTIYFHQVSASGNASGTTAESSPYWIMPNSAESGGTLAGVSMWKMTGLTGVTGVFNVLVLDGRTITGTVVDLWNAICGGTSTYYFSGVTQPVQTALNQLAPLLGVSTYLTGTTQVVQAALNQLQAMLGVSPTYLTSESDATAMAALAAAGAPGSTAGVSLYTPLETLASATARTAPGAVAAVSMYALPATKAQLNAAGAPGTTTGASLWSGASTYIVAAAQTGASTYGGANLTANQVACAIAVSFGASGDSTFVPVPWSFVVTGVSLHNASQGTGTAGASVYAYGATTQLFHVSGSGATAYSVSASGRIAAGTALLFQVGTIPTGQTLTETLVGRKE